MDRSVFGPLLETFAFAEVMKQVDWLAETCRLYQYRDKDQYEVDIIVEGEGGDVVRIELKAGRDRYCRRFQGASKAVCGQRQGFQTRYRSLRRGADGAFRRAHVRGAYLLPVGVKMAHLT